MDFNQVKSESRQGTKNILQVVFKYSNLLGLLGIIVAIILFLLADKKKELTLSTDSFISLVDKNSLSGSGIKVSFDSVPVDNLYKVNCSLINSGNSAVTKNDIIDNVKISFDPTAKLLKYEIDQTPKTIRTNDKFDRNTILLNPDLLNPNDKIFLTIYYTVSKTGVLPMTESRIVDGKILTINKLNTSSKKPKFIIPVSTQLENAFVWVMIIWNFLFFILVVWETFFQKNKSTFAVNLIVLFLLGSGFILTILYLLANEWI
ncbi:MAG: hypothetical protein A3G23_11865 [Bacteroidetes bacterium RIFCSPLOWO2_12_FULL_37_12]|nr:MAG: hypothetical protein A3G23_11865 [Bacteroidetes bacterium RIFCSPLOWO2_12_FULL_37_12]